MKRQGFTTIGLVIAILVVAAAVFGFMYFKSDVVQTKTDAAYRDFAEWTPENIAKDPATYLTFCETQTKAAVLKLKASEIAIAQKKVQIEGMLSDSKSKADTGAKAIDELKALYRDAEANKRWPVTWKAVSMDQDQCKRQILKFAGEVRSKTGLVQKLEAAVEQLRTQSSKVQEARDKAQEQLAQIATSREMLKIQQITDELKNTLVAMKGVIQTSVLGVAAAEPGTISLDDLAASSQATVDDEEFARLMKE